MALQHFTKENLLFFYLKIYEKLGCIFFLIYSEADTNYLAVLTAF